MNLLTSMILLGTLSLALAQTRGCRPHPGAQNIARNGEASQKSILQHRVMGYANKAIDGVKETNYHKGSCSHTNIEKDSWWQVDLKHMYKITNVVLTNRRDCCSERLLHAEIRIGNSPDNNNQVCGTVTSVADASLPFCCNGMLGRYVSVVIPRQLAMVTLCEVEIYGDLVTDEYKVCW